MYVAMRIPRIEELNEYHDPYGVRTILTHTGLPARFWAEAANYIACVKLSIRYVTMSGARRESVLHTCKHLKQHASSVTIDLYPYSEVYSWDTWRGPQLRSLGPERSQDLHHKRCALLRTRLQQRGF